MTVYLVLVLLFCFYATYVECNDAGIESEEHRYQLIRSDATTTFNSHSPLYQHLPDCRNEKNFVRIQKKTSEKGVICPMFRDEEGFLAEFVAYYQMHGIDHIILFDHGSTDNSYAEIQPWIESGFVEILTNITEMLDDMPYRQSLKKKGEFVYLMQGKAHLEKHCKEWAQANGYGYFFSVDIDEYMMPYKEGVTLMDAMHTFSQKSGISILDIGKLNFQATPHSVEPVNLLTIEAFQVRQESPNRMTYFKSVKSKVALRLNHASFTNEHRFYTISCCTFHGCASKIVGCRFGKNVTKVLYKGNSNKHVPFPLIIMHYSRTLEKYQLKSKTWKTASGEQMNADMYQVGGFMDRQLGVMYDNRAAVRYGCQLREELSRITGQKPFSRPGSFWLLNTKSSTEDGLNGASSSSQESVKNDYEYHGYYINQK